MTTPRLATELRISKRNLSTVILSEASVADAESKDLYAARAHDVADRHSHQNFAGHRPSRFTRRSAQSGYVIMVLLFMMAVLIVAAAASAPAVKQQLQRDREEEVIHRGSQYARAIKRYFKKFGRYPTSIEQLENTNNVRFLRRQYKDPLTPDGKWGLLHVGDVKLGTGANVGTPVSAMASPIGALGQPTTGGFGQSSFGGSFGQSSATPTGQQAGAGAAAAAAAGAGFIGGQPSTGAARGAGTSSGSSTSASAFGSSGPIGGAIIGVASTNENEGLHAFNEKTHYNQWYFVYDPTLDRGGLITGPFTGKTFQFGGAAGIGTPAGAQPAGQPGAFGQPSTFGQPSGFGQSMSQPGSAFGQPPQQPPKPPQQPQQ